MEDFCLVMVPHFSDGDIMANFDEDERKNSYFGTVCQITGESAASSDLELLVECTSLANNEVQLELSLGQLCGTTEQMVGLLNTNLPP